MQTTIRSTLSYSDRDSLIILLNNPKRGFPASLTAGEEKYAQNELKTGKRLVIINQYKRLVVLYHPDQKSNHSLLLEACRKAGDNVLQEINRQKISSVVIDDQTSIKGIALAFAEGLALGNYQFLKYRSDTSGKNDFSLKEILVRSKKAGATEISRMQYLTEAVVLARTLVNEPQSFLTSTRLGQEFVKMGKDAGFRVKVLNKQQIKALKMGGLLAVNQGSTEPPVFIIMEYRPRKVKNKKPYVLIGKGVVYDTGGLSLKPTANSMDFMKSDMAGAAAVGSAMYAIAKAKLPIHVVALVPSTDNRPGGNAYTPGDVVTMMSGKTVEVLNTDAEGRMLLADALHYAKRYDPELVMDFATLTGAAAAAVGPYGIVCMGTAGERVRKNLLRSGENVYERLAEFPFWEEYDELLKSDIADMKNIGGPVAGAITAGKFLQHFTGYPWMHFDIAGPSYLHANSSYRGKNGTGVGVRLLFDYFTNL